ncbi:MAG: DNA mismatch repair protein MutS [Parvibaculaceae bacterium]
MEQPVGKLAPEADPRPTPMMAQYLEIKAANPDCLLFYRMGDFYEMFFGDAETASRALGIALTRRGKHLGEDIPMCGVPVHAADDYLQKLIRLGHRVAVCEQTEDPEEARKRGSKSVVRRAVTRLVTPGTITEETLLDARRHNYLAALVRLRSEEDLALAWLDISTGDFCVSCFPTDALATEFARLEPGEVVLPDTLLADAVVGRLLQELAIPVTPLAASRFDSASGEHRLKQHFQVLSLDAFGSFSRAEVAAAGALLDYVTLTQMGRAPVISAPSRQAREKRMAIDAATRANLELTRTTSGERQGSFLHAIDLTVTGPGGRLLAEWLSSPLVDPDGINARLDAVGFLAERRDLRRSLREALKAAPDLGRALARLTVGRGSPRDLAAIRHGLDAAHDLARLLKEASRLGLPSLVDEAATTLADADRPLARALAEALAEELPLLARDGGFIRSGHLPELDAQRTLRDDTRKVVAGLQAKYAEETGIKGLKVRHNNFLGYHIEVAAQHGAALMAEPLSRSFVHRQTLANAMRFSTAELADLESRISLAASRAVAIEIETFERFVHEVAEKAGNISATAHALALLDVLASLAELADTHRFARPLIDASRAFRVRGGRHPVVEAALRREGHAFIANDCELSADGEEARHIWLLTGPNMAGKSTFLRQNALIAILAQTGSFVPAEEAHIGVVDRVFSRVGAADDLARGRSTFMVEMVETAAILNQASDRSLVILDEIGRGTATFDGLSIAWASVEHLHEVNRCRALFATHFHELTALSGRLSRLANATMKVREWQGDVVFLHEVTPGSADRSYGIQVAKLAGLPPAVVARAGEVLEILEQSEAASARRDLMDDLPLFAPRPVAPGMEEPRGPSEAERLIDASEPDAFSPREALELLYRLKAARRLDERA